MAEATRASRGGINIGVRLRDRCGLARASARRAAAGRASTASQVTTTATSRLQAPWPRHAPGGVPDRRASGTPEPPRRPYTRPATDAPRRREVSAMPEVDEIAEVDARFVREAIRVARVRMLQGRGGPFGAVVARNGVIVARGWNAVTSGNDPTAHAEVVAIRRACRALGTFSLAGCVLYASCEPCPMCLAAAYWARVDRLVYAATRDDAARAGFDDASSTTRFRCRPPSARSPRLSSSGPRRPPSSRRGWPSRTGAVLSTRAVAPGSRSSRPDRRPRTPSTARRMRPNHGNHAVDERAVAAPRRAVALRRRPAQERPR